MPGPVSQRAEGMAEHSGSAQLSALCQRRHRRGGTGGGLKNVYALGAGAIDGAGLGLSARSAFLARAFAELGRHDRCRGGKRDDAGRVGRDRRSGAVSARRNASRNYRFGMALGAGRKAWRRSGRAAWGWPKAFLPRRSPRRLPNGNGIDAPLIDAVNLADLRRGADRGDRADADDPTAQTRRIDMSQMFAVTAIDKPRRARLASGDPPRASCNIGRTMVMPWCWRARISMSDGKPWGSLMIVSAKSHGDAAEAIVGQRSLCSGRGVRERCRAGPGTG